MAKYEHISVYPTEKERLHKLKLVEFEPMHSVIRRLCDQAEKKGDGTNGTMERISQ